MDMLGEPDDVKGECNAHIYIRDNYDDGSRTIRCGKHKGHSDGHEAVLHEKDCVIQWSKDERRWDLEEDDEEDDDEL